MLLHLKLSFNFQNCITDKRQDATKNDVTAFVERMAELTNSTDENCDSGTTNDLSRLVDLPHKNQMTSLDNCEQKDKKIETDDFKKEQCEDVSEISSYDINCCTTIANNKVESSELASTIQLKGSEVRQAAPTLIVSNKRVKEKEPTAFTSLRDMYKKSNNVAKSTGQETDDIYVQALLNTWNTNITVRNNPSQDKNCEDKNKLEVNECIFNSSSASTNESSVMVSRIAADEIVHTLYAATTNADNKDNDDINTIISPLSESNEATDKVCLLPSVEINDKTDALEDSFVIDLTGDIDKIIQRHSTRDIIHSSAEDELCFHFEMDELNERANSIPNYYQDISDVREIKGSTCNKTDEVATIMAETTGGHKKKIAVDMSCLLNESLDSNDLVITENENNTLENMQFARMDEEDSINSQSNDVSESVARDTEERLNYETSTYEQQMNALDSTVLQEELSSTFDNSNNDDRGLDNSNNDDRGLKPDLLKNIESANIVVLQQDVEHQAEVSIYAPVQFSTPRGWGRRSKTEIVAEDVKAAKAKNSNNATPDKRASDDTQLMAQRPIKTPSNLPSEEQQQALTDDDKASQLATSKMNLQEQFLELQKQFALLQAQLEKERMEKELLAQQRLDVGANSIIPASQNQKQTVDINTEKKPEIHSTLHSSLKIETASSTSIMENNISDKNINKNAFHENISCEKYTEIFLETEVNVEQNKKSISQIISGQETPEIAEKNTPSELNKDALIVFPTQLKEPSVTDTKVSQTLAQIKHKNESADKLSASFRAEAKPTILFQAMTPAVKNNVCTVDPSDEDKELTTVESILNSKNNKPTTVDEARSDETNDFAHNEEHDKPPAQQGLRKISSQRGSMLFVSGSSKLTINDNEMVPSKPSNIVQQMIKQQEMAMANQQQEKPVKPSRQPKELVMENSAVSNNMLPSSKSPRAPRRPLSEAPVATGTDKDTDISVPLNRPTSETLVINQKNTIDDVAMREMPVNETGRMSEIKKTTPAPLLVRPAVNDTMQSRLSEVLNKQTGGNPNNAAIITPSGTNIVATEQSKLQQLTSYKQSQDVVNRTLHQSSNISSNDLAEPLQATQNVGNAALGATEIIHNQPTSKKYNSLSRTAAKQITAAAQVSSVVTSSVINTTNKFPSQTISSFNVKTATHADGNETGLKQANHQVTSSPSRHPSTPSLKPIANNESGNKPETFSPFRAALRPVSS